jgi:hypothetical protein
MNSHKNARLTQLGRVHLMQQISCVGLRAAAAFAGISVRRVYIWHSRWRECGAEGLYDRSSRPAFALTGLKRTNGNGSFACAAIIA